MHTPEQVALPIQAQRLRELIALSGLTMNEFSRRVGFSPSSVRNMVGGYSRITEKHIIRISRKCNVSADWLRGLSDDREEQ